MTPAGSAEPLPRSRSLAAPGRPPAAKQRRLAFLPKLFRTTAFRLSFAYLVTFAIFAFVALGYVAWNAIKVLDDQIVETIEAEIAGLAEQYRVAGIRRLVTVVDRRARQPGASLYLVTNFAGERIAGNIGALPAGTLDTAGQREVDYGRTDEEARDHRAIVKVFLLPGGFRLLVGRDVDERVRIGHIIGRTFGVSLLLVGVLGCLGGWFVTKRVLKRVDDMTATTETIMAGDLAERVGIAGTGDELDRLAHGLNAMLDRIGELMTGLAEVSNNIAHDLKTPLTRLRNRADEALRGPGSPEQLRAALDGVIEESDNLIRVFNALLTIARLEAGGQNDPPAEFDAAEVARSIAELYEPLAEEAGATVAVTTEGPLAVRGNRELLGQAVANLLDNAFKYGLGGGDRTVAVDARRIGEQVLLSVSDHGTGIPVDERARVFERFVRLEQSRSRPGFGLGLSLVAAVARLHGGSVSLDDNGPGLVVSLAIPAASAAGAP